MLRGYDGRGGLCLQAGRSVILRSKVAVFVELFDKTREIRRKAEQEQRLAAGEFRVRTREADRRAGVAPERGAPGRRSSGRCRCALCARAGPRARRAAVRQRQCRAHYAASPPRSSSTAGTCGRAASTRRIAIASCASSRACATRAPRDRIPLAVRRRPVSRLSRPGRPRPRRSERRPRRSSARCWT